jgi:hypothetical protein
MHVLSPKAVSVGTLVAELTETFNSRKGIATMWRKGSVSRSMDNALRRDAELIAPDEYCLPLWSSIRPRATLAKCPRQAGVDKKAAAIAFGYPRERS